MADLPYTFGYFASQSPAFLGFCALSKGIRFEANRHLRYLELGIGQGVSLNVHAAASPGEYWGNDIGATHVAHAQALAGASGSGARVLLESFEELVARKDLPQFDVITLHGIWSWVSDQDRAIIVEIAKRRLAPGGLLYVSYNCASGWAAATSVRHLMLAHALHANTYEAPLTEKVQPAMQFALQLGEAGAAYFRANPTVMSQLRAVADRSPTYLAHEFLGPHWRPMSFYETSSSLAEADLEFAGSTFLLEHGDRFTLNDGARALLASINHPVLREAAIECFINPQFRQDVFVKQPELLSAEERSAAFRRQRFILTTPIAAVSLTIPGPRGAVVLDPLLYKPMIEALAAQGCAAKSLDDIALALPGIRFEDLIDAAVILVGTGQVRPAVSTISERARACSQALNDYLCAQAIESGDLTVLASPVLGAGIPIARAEQLFLLALSEGASSPDEWGDFAASKITAVDQKELRDKLGVAAVEFESQTLPILKATGVA